MGIIKRTMNTATLSAKLNSSKKREIITQNSSHNLIFHPRRFNPVPTIANPTAQTELTTKQAQSRGIPLLCINLTTFSQTPPPRLLPGYMTNSCNISAIKYISRLCRPMISKVDRPGIRRAGKSYNEANVQESSEMPIVCNVKGGVQRGFDIGDQ
jgi:hypothetical protein